MTPPLAAARGLYLASLTAARARAAAPSVLAEPPFSAVGESGAVTAMSRKRCLPGP
jgi:hypothetical protein